MSDVQPSDSLTNAADGVRVGPQADPLAHALRITNDIFPGPTKVEEEFDPEDPEDQWQVVIVPVTGTVKEIVERKSLWHRRMILELGAAGHGITIRVVPTLL
jgi:hypothetical protein